MHELLEEVMEVARLFISELVCDDADLEWWRHEKERPRICDSALDDELMHRLSKLLLKGALYRLELNGKLGDHGMEPELHMPVILVDEVLHGPRRMLQQHLMKFVFLTRPPHADLGDGFAFSSRELFRGEVGQDSVLRTAVGQREKRSCKTQLPTAPEPDCRLFGHGVLKIVASRASLATACTPSDIAVDTRTPLQRPRPRTTHLRRLFTRRDSKHAKHRRQGIGFGIGGTTATRNKCSSHGRSSFFSSCSKLNAFITERSRAWARGKRFGPTPKGDYVPVHGVNKSDTVRGVYETLALQGDLVQVLCRNLQWFRRKQANFHRPEGGMLPRHTTERESWAVTQFF
jgi:hypothetical protein